MSRTLIVVGNGLGMAIAPDAFQLKPVMQQVWHEMKGEERNLLASYFSGIDRDHGPTSEADLMVAQVAVLMPSLIEKNGVSP